MNWLKFYDETIFRKHIDDHITKSLECNKCPTFKLFATKYEIKLHNKIHLEQRSLKCDYCPKSYDRKDSLMLHVRSHTGERPFKCGLCPYAGAKKSSLVAHIKLHQNNPSYVYKPKT